MKKTGTQTHTHTHTHTHLHVNQVVVEVANMVDGAVAVLGHDAGAARRQLVDDVHGNNVALVST